MGMRGAGEGGRGVSGGEGSLCPALGFEGKERGGAPTAHAGELSQAGATDAVGQREGKGGAASRGAAQRSAPPAACARPFRVSRGCMQHLHAGPVSALLVRPQRRVESRGRAGWCGARLRGRRAAAIDPLSSSSQRPVSSLRWEEETLKARFAPPWWPLGDRRQRPAGGESRGAQAGAAAAGGSSRTASSPGVWRRQGGAAGGCCVAVLMMR